VGPISPPAVSRRLNWTEAISRAQRAPTKGPSGLNQRQGTTHGGAGEVRGAGGWVPDPTCHARPDCALENGSPAGRGAGGCQVVVARGRPPGPGWDRAGIEARGGWRDPGPVAGEGAAASRRVLFSKKSIRVREPEWACIGPIEPVYRDVPICRVRGTAACVLVRVAKAAAKRCRSGTGLRNGCIFRDPALHKRQKAW
jgi:hypothetical protein